MSHDSPGPVVDRLAACRALLRDRGVAGFDDGALRLSSEPLEPVAPADQEELLAWEALASGRPGWATVCLLAASELRQGAAADETRADAERVLRESFEPFSGEEELLEALAEWIPVRLGELASRGAAEALRAAEGAAPHGDRAWRLRLRWWLRCRATLLAGPGLPLDRAARRLGLDERDRWLLRILVALGGDGVRVRALSDLWTEDPDERTVLAERLGPAGPLQRWGLVESEGGALRVRPVARALVAGTALLETLPPDPEALDVPEPVRSRLGRAFAAEPGPRCVALTGVSPVPGARLVAAWAADRGRPAVLVRAGPDLDPVAIARSARLHGAITVVLLSGSSEPPPWLEALGPLLGEPLVVVGTAPSLRHLPQPAARIRVRAQRSGPGPEAWNQALGRVGLAPLRSDQLQALVGQLNLGAAQLQVVAEAAAVAAWTAPGAGPVETPGVEELLALAQDYRD